MSADRSAAVEFFAGHPRGERVAAEVARVIDGLGPHTVRVTKSQVTFARRRGFAYLWRPGQYVRSEVPAVLSIALPREVEHARWKQVVHPSGRVWMHHLEMESPDEVDDDVRAWLAEAYDAAS